MTPAIGSTVGAASSSDGENIVPTTVVLVTALEAATMPLESGLTTGERRDG